MPLAIALLLLVVAIPLVVALLRANELFCLRLRRGQVRVVRGRLPAQLLTDIGDVLRADDPGELTLRGVVEDQRVRVYAEGRLSEAQRQQLRNLVGQYPVAKIRNAPRR